MDQPTATSTEENLPSPVLFLLLLKDGTAWQMGQSVPGSDEMGTVDPDGSQHPERAGQQALKIVRMVEREAGEIYVYALPVSGSNFDREKQGVIFKHPSDQVKQSTYLARFDAFRFHLEQEISEWEEETDDEDELPPKLETRANGAAEAAS
jgi:hypothetical protein